MEKKKRKRNVRLKDILVLQAVIVLYTFSSVAAKLASGQEPFSAPFLLFYLAELTILGVYALLWQQLIRKFELSVAYAKPGDGASVVPALGCGPVPRPGDGEKRDRRSPCHRGNGDRQTAERTGTGKPVKRKEERADE